MTSGTPCLSGECPCCERKFGNLRAHMERAHPEFVADAGTAAPAAPLMIEGPRP